VNARPSSRFISANKPQTLNSSIKTTGFKTPAFLRAPKDQLAQSDFEPEELGGIYCYGRAANQKPGLHHQGD
jgi:hypothetical protein